MKVSVKENVQSYKCVTNNNHVKTTHYLRWFEVKSLEINLSHVYTGKFLFNQMFYFMSSH